MDLGRLWRCEVADRRRHRACWTGRHGSQVLELVRLGGAMMHHPLLAHRPQVWPNAATMARNGEGRDNEAADRQPDAKPYPGRHWCGTSSPKQVPGSSRPALGRVPSIRYCVVARSAKCCSIHSIQRRWTSRWRTGSLALCPGIGYAMNFVSTPLSLSA